MIDDLQILKLTLKEASKGGLFGNHEPMNIFAKKLLNESWIDKLKYKGYSSSCVYFEGSNCEDISIYTSYQSNNPKNGKKVTIELIIRNENKNINCENITVDDAIKILAQIVDKDYENIVIEKNNENQNSMNDLNESADLIDVEDEFREKYKEITLKMKQNKEWYEIDGFYKGERINDFENLIINEIKSFKHLCLGRSTYYDNFLIDMEKLYGHKVYQSDYMVWINPADPYESLLYYIDTAKQIDFSLEGISFENLKTCLKINKVAESRYELGSPFMTLWEINQIIFTDYRYKTTWHIRGELNKKKVEKLFKKEVEYKNLKIIDI